METNNNIKMSLFCRVLVNETDEEHVLSLSDIISRLDNKARSELNIPHDFRILHQMGIHVVVIMKNNEYYYYAL